MAKRGSGGAGRGGGKAKSRFGNPVKTLKKVTQEKTTAVSYTHLTLPTILLV